MTEHRVQELTEAVLSDGEAYVCLIAEAVDTHSSHPWVSGSNACTPPRRCWSKTNLLFVKDPTKTSVFHLRIYEEITCNCCEEELNHKYKWQSIWTKRSCIRWGQLLLVPMSICLKAPIFSWLVLLPFFLFFSGHWVSYQIDIFWSILQDDGSLYPSLNKDF